MSLDVMKQALAALEECTAYTSSEYPSVTKECEAAITALRAAIDQAQEPVAVVKYMETGGNAGIATRIVEIYDPMRERLRAGDKLYTAPRQWQGLTDEEREHVINANFGTGLWQMAKDIEAKLKEKNT